MSHTDIFQNKSWDSGYIKETLGLFNYEGICLFINESSLFLDSVFPKDCVSYMEQLRFLRTNDRISKDDRKRAIQALVTEVHELSHFNNFVGTTIGLTGYVINYNRAILAIDLIKRIGENNSNIFMPLSDWIKTNTSNILSKNPELVDACCNWIILSNQFNLLFSLDFVGTELGEIKKRIPGYNYVFSPPPAQVFPNYPDCFSTIQILEALAVCEEIISLVDAGYDNNEIAYFTRNRPFDVYHSLLTRLYGDFKIDLITAKTALKLSLFSDLEPCYSKKLACKPAWEDTFPPWRLFKIVNEIKKVGLVERRMLDNDKALENYLNKLCDNLSWPHVRTFFDIGASANFSEFYKEIGNMPYYFISEQPVFKHFLKTHKMISCLSQKSPSYRFFDIIDYENIDLVKKIRPPFKIYKDEILRPDWMHPQSAAAMSEYLIFGTAIREILTEKTLEYTTQWSELFEGKGVSQAYLNKLFEKNFGKNLSDFKTLQ
jgi:hypothetical protein